MKLKVTEEGVLIPKELLGDSQEVEVIQEEEKLVMKIKKNKKVERLQSNLEPRKPGYWGGKVKIADDFDILPDSIQNGFMGLTE
ncbi:MAG: hypothetical protein QNJ33_17295 [Crocosphaera sp.]|nr:hypothetical protein [Crocosphaera sp.]